MEDGSDDEGYDNEDDEYDEEDYGSESDTYTENGLDQKPNTEEDFDKKATFVEKPSNKSQYETE